MENEVHDLVTIYAARAVFSLYVDKKLYDFVNQHDIRCPEFYIRWYDEYNSIITSFRRRIRMTTFIFPNEKIFLKYKLMFS